MSNAEIQLIRIYLRGFGDDPAEWSSTKHLAGIKEVFRAGADAGRRQALIENEEAVTK